jgi:hypothetical protein
MPITNIHQDGQTYTFTINTPVCFVNALRRTVLSDIPTIVFETSPAEKNKVDIEINTSRFNNEIVKQRFSCIPIHIKDHSIPIDTLEIHIDVQNTTENVINITTGDIKIYDTNTKKYIADTSVRKIFPPNSFTGDYIIINRLRPRINAENPGEHFKCKAKMSISTAAVSGCFNVSHNCFYYFEKDITKQETVWEELKHTIVLPDDDAETESLKKKNWLLGEGTKITKPNTFNFKLETIGVFSNLEIINKAFTILIDTFEKYKAKNDYSITPTPAVINNSYDIKIEDDYTIGYILQTMLYQNFYDKEKILNFVGFKKFHPHDSYSIIRMAFINQDSNEETAISLFKRAVEKTIEYLHELNSKFI